MGMSPLPGRFQSDGGVRGPGGPAMIDEAFYGPMIVDPRRDNGADAELVNGGQDGHRMGGWDGFGREDVANLGGEC